MSRLVVKLSFELWIKNSIVCRVICICTELKAVFLVLVVPSILNTTTKLELHMKC